MRIVDAEAYLWGWVEEEGYVFGAYSAYMETETPKSSPEE